MISGNIRNLKWQNKWNSWLSRNVTVNGIRQSSCSHSVHRYWLISFAIIEYFSMHLREIVWNINNSLRNQRISKDLISLQTFFSDFIHEIELHSTKIRCLTEFRPQKSSNMCVFHCFCRDFSPQCACAVFEVYYFFVWLM